MDIDEILKELDDPEKPAKKPVNLTKFAIIFADLIFALLDAGSGIGVAYLTNVWYYGVVVFFAGIIPLVLWQFLFTHAYASDKQKMASLIGGGLAVASVVIVAASVAVMRFWIDGIWTEIGLAVLLVLFAAIHGLIAAYYYYSDEEIIENQKSTRIVGNAARKVLRYRAARIALKATQKAADERKQVSGEYSPEAVDKVLGDKDPNA